MEVNLKIKAILHPNDRKSMPSNVIPQTNLVIYIYIYCKRTKQFPTNSKFMERLLLWHHIKPYEYTKLDHATIKIVLKANQISSHNKLLYFDYCMTKNIFIPSIYFESSKKKKSQIEDHGMKFSIVIIVQQLMAHCLINRL